jgi:hypothetical protein
MMSIYVDRCLTEQKWTKLGVDFVTGTWLNLLHAVIHEFVHIWQLEDEPHLEKSIPSLPMDYEEEAWEITNEIIDDFKEWLSPPKIEEMGWMGQQIMTRLNMIFMSHPNKVQEILQFNGRNLAGKAEVIARLSGHYENEDAIKRLLQLIDEGREGMKMGNERYLTFQDAVGLCNYAHAGKENSNLSYEETMAICKSTLT